MKNHGKRSILFHKFLAQAVSGLMFFARAPTTVGSARTWLREITTISRRCGVWNAESDSKPPRSSENGFLLGDIHADPIIEPVQLPFHKCI